MSNISTQSPAAPDTQRDGKDFLLLEYERLNDLHQAAKDEGDKRLNFYVTFIAALGAFLVAVDDLVSSNMHVWVVVGGLALVVLIGSISFRKMLQRRAATIIYRRRLGRIRAWFAEYDPAIVPGLPYDIRQDLPMDWGKNRLGTTAFSIALINAVIVSIIVLAAIASAVDLSKWWWLLLFAPLSGAATWWLHMIWKARWMVAAEALDQKDKHALDELVVHQEPTREKH